MTTRTIRPGHTISLNRSLPADGTLVLSGGLSSGAPGGTGIVADIQSNAGTIEIDGGVPGAGSASGQGGTLDVTGVLTSMGVIDVGTPLSQAYKAPVGAGGLLDIAGTGTLALTASATLSVSAGHYGYGGNSAGGLLENAGVLTNAGLLNVQGSDYGFVGSIGQGGALTNAGTLTNTGTLVVGGGIDNSFFYGDGGHGATLSDSGMLVNQGLLTVGGGAGGGYLSKGGTGGTLDITGVLSNAGTLLLGGGGGGINNYAYGGTGALLTDSGVLTNTGVIEVGAGQGNAAYYGAGLGAQLDIAGTLNSTGTLLLDGSSLYTRFGYGGGGGGKLALTGVLTTGGLLSIGGGAPTPGVTYGGYTNGGVLTVDSGGKLTNTGQVLVRGGLAGAPVTPGGAGGTLALGVGAVLTNSGTIIVGAGAPSTQPAGRFGDATEGAGGLLDVGLGANLGGDGVIELQAGAPGSGGGASGEGAVLSVEGRLTPGRLIIDGSSTGGNAALLAVSASGSVNASSLVENAGLISLAGGYVIGRALQNGGLISGAGAVGSSFGTTTNDGTILATGGGLKIDGVTLTADAGHAGILEVAVGASLNLTALSSITGQTVVLDGPSSVVSLYGAQAGVLIESALGGVLDLAPLGAKATLNAADTHLWVFLSGHTDLTLSKMGFIDATGSSGNDTITALSSNQTLTGGLGLDHLYGAAATGDLFLDTAAGLNGDVIGGFAGRDAIDITNIASAGVSLAYVQGSGQGKLTVAGGGTSSSITLLGSFTTGNFATASDGHGGVLITLHG